jgi:ArsR family transcriptional regulator
VYAARVPSTAVITPRRRSAGPSRPPLAPDLDAAEALLLAAQVKALADPTRLRILDVLRKAAPHAICQCDLTPLFDMSQQALSKHLKILTGAGVIGSERRGVWRYYFISPGGLERIRSWLS